MQLVARLHIILNGRWLCAVVWPGLVWLRLVGWLVGVQNRREVEQCRLILNKFDLIKSVERDYEILPLHSYEFNKESDDVNSLQSCTYCAFIFTVPPVRVPFLRIQ